MTTLIASLKKVLISQGHHERPKVSFAQCPCLFPSAKFKLRAITIGVALVSAALLAYLATPRLKEDTASVEIEANTPAVVGQWRQLPNASILGGPQHGL